MTKVTHTPGPWHVEPLQWDHGASIAIVANGQIICTIAPENEEDDVTMETAIRGPRDEANACLIAVAPEMLDALELCEHVLSELAQHDDGTQSISARDVARQAIAKAKDMAAQSNTNLPPDPEGMNGRRAGYVAAAIHQFQSSTGTDWEDAVADLLCDLIHFCDRESFNFDKELDRARMHYQAETTEGGAP